MVSITDNAKKVAYLATLYPKHKLTELMGLFTLPGADMTAALWRAQDMGWIETDSVNNTIKTLEVPDFNFDESVMGIQDLLTYLITKWNSKEDDVEEEPFMMLFAQYLSHDVVIAIKQLIAEGKIATYAIKDISSKQGESVYTFYTLPANLDKKWGKKQFKSLKHCVIVG